MVTLGAAWTATPARAVPSFARQMDTRCIQCHTEFPILTEQGRQFKLSGYTLAAGDTHLPPIAVMLQPSFTHTAAGQPGGAAPGFHDNNNFALTQASVFYSGRVLGPYAERLLGPDAAAFANKIGVFLQTTYDGVGKQWAWDNAELRFADTGTLRDEPIQYGVYLNNNPTMQDLWNTTPAWGFPFSGSGLAPTPAAATLIDGGLAQQVAGLGAYVMWSNSLYLDIGGYRSLSTRFQRALGVDPTGEAQLADTAPYWRLAWTHPTGSGAWEVGTFGLAARTYPGRDASAGSDRTDDFGFDTEYQLTTGRHDAGLFATYIVEQDRWHASQALGNTANASGTLRNLKFTVTDLYDKTYGATVQYFTVYGSHDPGLYNGSRNASPYSDGFVFQADFLPVNKMGGPAFWPRSNVKITLQYTLYLHFDGERIDFDGSGRNARDNNTLYLETWIDF